MRHPEMPRYQTYENTAEGNNPFVSLEVLDQLYDTTDQMAELFRKDY